VNSHPLPVNNQQQTVILSRRRRICLIIHLEEVHIFSILKLLFYMNLKMQNKPKSQTDGIPVSPYNLLTSNFYLLTPDHKNKPKQTQINPSYRNSQQNRGGANRPNRKEGSANGRILIFDICDFIFDMHFMTNEPNPKTPRNNINPYTLRTKDDRRRTAFQKSKPKRTQFMNISASPALKPP